MNKVFLKSKINLFCKIFAITVLSLLLVNVFTSCEVDVEQSKNKSETDKVYYYTVCFNANGGSGNMQNQIFISGQKQNLLSNQFTRENYTFVGWSRTPDGSGVFYCDGQSVFDLCDTNKGEVILYAKWKLNGSLKYTVKHFKQNVELNGYVEDRSAEEILYGKLGEYTKANPKSFEGFTLVNYNQKKIEESESIVVSIYYNRNKYTLTIKLNGGSIKTNGSNSTKDVKLELPYGKEIPSQQIPEKTGYDFTGWSSEFPQKMPAKNLEVTAQWQGGKNIRYTVNHYLQNIEKTGYELTRTESFAGQAGTLTELYPKNYRGFTVKDFDELEILGDGSTVVDICYDRNNYTITYKLNGGSIDGSTSDIVSTYAYDEAISDVPTPTRDGYEFRGWDSVPWEMPANNIEVSAVWVQGRETAYKVEHYLQNVAGTDYELEETENLKGITEDTTSVRAKDYEGFTCNGVTQKEIRGDGKTAVQIYYRRNKYSLVYKLDGGKINNSSDDISLEYYYGAEIEVPEEPTRDGYAFTGWSSKLPEIMPSKNFEVTAEWSVGTETPYRVEHYVQHLEDSNFDLWQTEWLSGTTFEQTAAVKKNLTGFSTKAVTQKEIRADGGTCIQIYYYRNKYTITYKLDGGNINNSTSDINTQFLYRQNVAEQPLPTRKSYEFMGWSSAIPAIMPAYNVEVTALWKLTEASYEVKHYLQSVSCDDYYLISTVSSVGLIGEQTEADSKVYTGFTCNGVKQKEITSEGTVVEIYYDRNKYSITYNLNGGNINDSSEDITRQIVYGAEVPALEEPARQGYVFNGWDSNIPLTMPARNISVTADWTKVDSGFTVTMEKITTDPEMNFSFNTKTTEMYVSNRFDSYIWFIDGVRQVFGGNCISLNPICLSAGFHTITVSVTGADDEIYTTTATIRIQK